MHSPEYQTWVERLVVSLKSIALEQPRKIHEKAALDFVTAFDHNIDSLVRKCIEKYFPGELIASEENWPEKFGTANTTLWVIDPLDGTSNYVAGLPFWGVSIARICNARVDFALIVDTGRDELFSAQAGRGAFLNGQKLTPIENRSSLLGVSSGFLSDAGNKAGAIKNLAQSVKFRLLGSQALHLCYVASGRLRAAINIESKIWDDIAGALIVEEAGGCYRSLAGVDHAEPAMWPRDAVSSGLAVLNRNDDIFAQLQALYSK